ncbi:MAG: SMC-Scp complex subunit ScpB [Candidatus Woesearchaeota archaeon]
MPIKNRIEALLFSAGRYVKEEDLCQLTGEKHKDIIVALKQLKQDYEAKDGALRVVTEGTSWKINVTEKYIDLVTKIVADTELAFPVLETLSIIAYKAPILQSDLVNVRGNGAYDHIAELMDKGFISREKSGRSFSIRLADKFFEYFDVPGEKDIKDVLQDVKKKRLEQEKTKAKERQKMLGALEVVEVPKDEEKQGETQDKKPELAGFEVVDASDEPDEKYESRAPTSSSEEEESEENPKNPPKEEDEEK